MVQPRLNTVVDSDMIDREALYQWAEIIKTRADQTQSAHAVRMPGNHCKYCAAAFRCPEYQTIRSQPIRMVVDLHGLLSPQEALVVGAQDIRAGIKAAIDSTAEWSDWIEVPSIEELRWTRAGKTAAVNHYGIRIAPNGQVLSPRQAQRQLGISDETLAKWTYKQPRRKAAIAKVV